MYTQGSRKKKWANTCVGPTVVALARHVTEETVALANFQKILDIPSGQVLSMTLQVCVRLVLNFIVRLLLQDTGAATTSH